MGKKRKRSEKDHASSSSVIELPSFDESALSALTNKIESGFRKTVAPGQNYRGRNPSRAEDPKRGTNRVQISKPLTQDRVPEKEYDARSIGRDETGHGSGSARARKDERSAHNGDEQNVLLQEILALGGTEDDLDLVMGVATDEDDLGDAIPKLKSTIDPKLTKEVSKFIASLGIETQSIEKLSGAGSDEDTEDESQNISTKFKSQSANEVKGVKSSNLQGANNSSKGLKDLMFEARPDWHAAPLPALPDPDISDLALLAKIISELKNHARKLLEIDSELYTSKNLSSTSSHRFFSTIMSSGTLSDKISALTLVIQESPVHTMKYFESLLALAKKRSRGQAVSALGAIKDLLGVGVVLPSDRRLRHFESQPGLLGTLQANAIRNWKSGDNLPGHITNAHLVSWAYEDWLKEMYFDVLKVLEAWCNDEIVYARGRAVTYVYELLREKPEQESNLLRLLVNKLGDPDKKIASRASHLILQLQTTHPLMKLVIIRAIETELLLRPGQSSHAKYYAINTLNQTILSVKEEDVACKLLNIYFSLFVTLLKKVDSPKSIAGPLVNRKGQIQGGGGKMGKKAIEKAKKEDILKQGTEATTEKMISAVLTGVNRAFPFTKSDDSTLEQHMSMLFKITHSSNFNTSIQALMLIQQLSASKHLAEDRFYRTLYESLLDPRLVTSSKHAMYLNLLFRALKSDLSVKRVKAFAKRLLQIITLHQPPFICGVLYLLRELEGTFRGLSLLLTSPEESGEADEEVFLDVPDDGMEAISRPKFPQGSGVHPDREAFTKITGNGYDGRKRDPEHSRADRSCLWELLPFVAHFHPSVSLFATRLLYGKEMPAKPDLASHSLIHFLDRFVYRNAKTAVGSLRGSSIMQPLAGGEGRDVLISKRLVNNYQEPLNSDSFWRKKADDVAVDEAFFHKYFNHIAKGKKPTLQKSRSTKNVETVDGGEDEGENEDEIWQALVDSRPELEGHSEEEEDLEMLDLDDSEDDSEDDSSLDEEVDIELDNDVESGLEVLDDDDLHGEGSDVSRVDGMDGPLMLSDLLVDKLNEDDRMEDNPEVTQKRKSKRRKFKNLPIFASTEEYAEMLEDDEDMD